MRRVKRNPNKCKNCGRCEEILPKFRSVYGGILLVNSHHPDYQSHSIQITAAMAGCPNGAISVHLL